MSSKKGRVRATLSRFIFSESLLLIVFLRFMHRIGRWPDRGLRQQHISSSFGFALLGWWLLSGCTSLQFHNYKQPVKITTVIPGIEIWDGESKLGETPDLILLERSRKKSLLFKAPELSLSETKELKTSYRWGESFFSSLIFGILSPISIGTDFLTETAWEYDHIEPLEFEGLNSVSKNKIKLFKSNFRDDPSMKDHTFGVLVAPTQGLNLLEADLAAGVVERHLSQKKSNFKILPYKDHFLYLERAGYTYLNALPLSQLDLAFFNAKSRALLESNYDPRRKVIKYQVREIFSGESLTQGEIPYQAQPWNSKIQWSSRFLAFLPNSLLLDLGPKHFVYQQDRRPVFAVANEYEGWAGQASKFLGTVGAASLIPPSPYKGFDWGWRLTSGLDFTYKSFYFIDDQLPDSNVNYGLARLAAALGPQLYLQTFVGTLYISAMWGLGHQKISWDGDHSGSYSGWTFNSITNVGFYRYFSSRFALHLYSRNLSEDSEIWKRIMSRSQNYNFTGRDFRTMETGLSVVFFFPEARHFARNHFLKSGEQ